MLVSMCGGAARGCRPFDGASTQENTMRQIRNWLALCVFVGVAAGVAARADDDKEEKVPLDKVPEAVLKAVKEKFKDAELVSAQTEKEDGKLIYEINLKDKGQSVDVSLTADGKIVSIERTIAAKDLPRPVTETLNRKYPGAEFKTVEEVTENDKTNYEVLLVTADKKKIEVVLDRDGKIVKEEKKEEKKDK
jgi:uncharacterized membrane protein YkoI